ncbi:MULTISPECIES: GNAT family N-acetyltransferase [Allobacillus]|uniref:GNAT family N-acetyltransferase n=1 Tax=Allobacillus salarius TaxID=1955272 RepID=A0A556PM98_9BACI|nr:GNAT family N-acetyltransferase [Allobacillus salarius]TSJ65516.1 GNAT family N-acetyltransferase [Allobacillus salarius]
MTWYEKLNEYFPIEEMKSKEHFEILLDEKGNIYHKDESEDHVLMYAEYEQFIFVDYVYVSSKARGKGIGKQLIGQLKTKGKPIILEVEPVDYEDTDTAKRLRFYERENFQHAKTIGYEKKSIATNEVNPLEILFWSPIDEDEELIYEKMKKTYVDIHTYKDKEIYGESYQPVDQVFKRRKRETDIFEDANELQST